MRFSSFGLTACNAGPTTISRIDTHQVTIDSPTSSTEAQKTPVAVSDHCPAEWNGNG